MPAGHFPVRVRDDRVAAAPARIIDQLDGTVIEMTTLDVRIREFIQENFPTPGELPGDQSLLQSGIIDSLGVLSLVTWIEQEFEVVVDDDDVVPENLDSVDRLVAFVDRKLGQTASSI
jgi:acyl carrier protein